MRQIDDDAWRRRGFALLWCPAALGDLCRSTSEIISIRELFKTEKKWPETLPSNDGTALVVTGLEGCIDRISPSDAEAWIETDLRPILLRFQREYDDAALIFWMPTGEKRVDEVAIDDTISWKYEAPFRNIRFPLALALFGGAHKDARKIMAPEADSRGQRRQSWIGIYLPRIS
jgi:hypothetical protein